MPLEAGDAQDGRLRQGRDEVVRTGRQREMMMKTVDDGRHHHHGGLPASALRFSSPRVVKAMPPGSVIVDLAPSAAATRQLTSGRGCDASRVTIRPHQHHVHRALLTSQIRPQRRHARQHRAARKDPTASSPGAEAVHHMADEITKEIVTCDVTSCIQRA
jgi:hypothetical protein